MDTVKCYTIISAWAYFLAPLLGTVSIFIRGATLNDDDGLKHTEMEVCPYPHLHSR